MSNAFQFFQHDDDDYDARRFVEDCLEKQLERVRAFTRSINIMTITMLLGLLSIAWEDSWNEQWLSRIPAI